MTNSFRSLISYLSRPFILTCSDFIIDEPNWETCRDKRNRVASTITFFCKSIGRIYSDSKCHVREVTNQIARNIHAEISQKKSEVIHGLMDRCRLEGLVCKINLSEVPQNTGIIQKILFGAAKDTTTLSSTGYQCLASVCGIAVEEGLRHTQWKPSWFLRKTLALSVNMGIGYLTTGVTPGMLPLLAPGLLMWGHTAIKLPIMLGVRYLPHPRFSNASELWHSIENNIINLASLAATIGVGMTYFNVHPLVPILMFIA